MQGKILIVDAIATNRIVLKVKLKKAYYGVVQAATVQEALALARGESPDLIIAALSLPDGDAAALCRLLKDSPATEHIPVLAIAAQPTREDRLMALEAGLQEVFAQPVDETLLMGRVRSLIRAHNASAEWQLREDTCRALGLAEKAADFQDQGQCMLVGQDAAAVQKYAGQLRAGLRVRIAVATTRTLMQHLDAESLPDIFVLILSADPAEAIQELRLISTLRANAKARHAGVIVMQTAINPAMGANALDLGADDLMINGFDAAELALRIKALMRRKRMGEQLRASVRTGLQAAVFDPLTGLHNRRYAMPHLARIAEHATTTGRSFAVMLGDLDHFKRINDAYGHASGDAVLIEVGNRLRRVLRSTDMIARIGGEEFLMIMPGTDLACAQGAALRLCADISSEPFIIPGSRIPITVTISIGMAIGGKDCAPERSPEEIGRALLEQADRALYAAKGRGRNQVKLGRPAA